MMIHTGARGWSAAVIIALLTGCGMLGSKPVNFYVLDATSYTQAELPVVSRPLSVEVYGLRLPQYLERPQIVTRSEQNRLNLAEYHQWGGNLRKNMGRVLAMNLATLLATPEVYIAPHQSPRRADVRIELEVLRFERGADGHVMLSVQLHLADGKRDRGADGSAAGARLLNLVSAGTHVADDYAGIVTSMSALYGELSRQIAEEIQRRYAGA